VGAVVVAQTGRGVDDPVGDARTVERRVEAVAAQGERRLHGHGVQSGVDADEQQFQAGPDRVGQGSSVHRL